MADVPFKVRNLHFAVGSEVPRHWLGGRRSVTSFLDNLSVFFPAGERFFVASVRAHERFVKDDEALRLAVRAFCGQEGVHSREHVRYNAMLRAQGYPVEEMERRVVRLLRLVSSVLPARLQLAVTCALEHFTALMGQMVLKDARILEGADPTMAALWRWHAAEENEHRAVAFDVFVAAGGTYIERVVVMILATAIFWAKVVEHQARMMNADGLLFSGREWAELVRFLFVSPGGLTQLIGPYLAWFRPSFHPNEMGSDALVGDWQRMAEEAAARG